MTVLCPGCAADWPLAPPPPDDPPALITVDCECGASFEVDAEGQVRQIRPRRVVGEEHCANHQCVCHTIEEKRVTTPFPLGYGPPYCCMRCARLADGTSRHQVPRRVDTIVREILPP